MISGDFNADTEDLATLQQMLDEEGWTDVGAQGHRWGARRSEATCWAPNSGLSGTRRDFVITNSFVGIFAENFGDRLVKHVTKSTSVQTCMHLSIHYHLKTGRTSGSCAPPSYTGMVDLANTICVCSRSSGMLELLGMGKGGKGGRAAQPRLVRAPRSGRATTGSSKRNKNNN